MAEIELIQATSTLIGKLDFQDFTIRINDRRILKAMASYSGFAAEDYDNVFITLDKMDKIGIEGVQEELTSQGYAKEKVEKYIQLFENTTGDLDGVAFLKETLANVLDENIATDLETIMQSVEAVKSANFKLVFDPTLVRGMSYYTGPIFEISIDGFGGSVGGGGRYDEMIGRFTGNQTPACGFSVGFERIVMLLLEKNYQIPDKKEKIAFLVEKRMPAQRLQQVMKEADQLRKEGKTVSLNMMKKNKKFQKEQLEAEGYTSIQEFFCQ